MTIYFCLTCIFFIIIFKDSNFITKGFKSMKHNNNLDTDQTLNRRAQLLELLEKNGQVKVNNLSTLFGVSEVTIRNDLALLEKKGLLIRGRGGAIRNRRVAVDYTLSVKEKKNLKEKQAIGKKTVELFNKGETIILDSGTTTMQVAKNLSDFSDITVITHALNIASQLAQNPNIKVIMPGGFLRGNSLSLVGAMAEDIIRNYYCDKVVLGVDGIDSHYGISTPNMEEAHLNKTMIEVAREVIVVTDSSKFLKRSFAFIAPVSQIDIVITDPNLPDSERSRLEDAGVKVILV